MKRIIFFFVLLLSGFLIDACPICGCGGGNLYMGLMPDFQKQFFGIRYHYANFHTQLVSDPTQFSTNYYNTIEFWGGTRISRKVQLLAFLPYYQNKQIDDDGTSRPSGLGDISILGQYQVFHFLTANKSRKLIDQQLWVGGGLKLPTGSFNVNTADTTTTVADINAQLGTGSVDFLLNALYSLRFGNLGFNVSANYKINTVNHDNYKYGNKFTANFIAYYRIPIKKSAISPNLGVGYENVTGNELQGKQVEFTGSHEITALAGLEYSVGKIGFGINAQLPLEQEFAEGQTKLRMKAMAHITFAL
jgi:hypothetical protein